MKKKFKLKLILAFIISIILIIKAYSGSNYILVEKAKSVFLANLSTAVYLAIESELEKNGEIKNFFNISYNEQGNVSFISSDSFQINLLAKNISLKTCQIYEKNYGKTVEIPIGAFFGVGFLAGVGKKINVNLISINSCKSNFFMNFESAGINQTRQTLVLKIYPDVDFVYLFSKNSFQTEIEILVYDNLICGNVPSHYFGGITFNGG